MNTTKLNRPSCNTQLGTQAGGRRFELPDWPELWPGSDAVTDKAADAVLEESVTDPDQESAANRVAGARSESLGQ